MTVKASSVIPEMTALVTHSQAINDRCRNINKQLNEFENSLKSLNLCVSAWAISEPLKKELKRSWDAIFSGPNKRPEDKDKQDETLYFLGFVAYDGPDKRRLMIGETTRELGDTSTNEPSILCPATEATLELRINALSPSIQRLLVTNLERNAQSYLRELDERISISNAR